jgi:hypothetical protein
MANGQWPMPHRQVWVAKLAGGQERAGGLQSRLIEE